MGRGKKAAGDVADDESLRREGAHQEAEGSAEDRADSAEATAQAAREEGAEHRAERENYEVVTGYDSIPAARSQLVLGPTVWPYLVRFP